MDKFKAAVIQLASGSNIHANLFEAERLIAQAAQKGAQLVILPENFAFMGHECADMLSVQEIFNDGPIQYFLSQTAQKYGLWLVGGTVPISTDDPKKIKAACLVYDDRGQLKARYDKIHLFDVNLDSEQYRESDTLLPGDQVQCVHTPFGCLGLAVCYDLRFPELFRAMLEKGLDLIALPAAFTAITGEAHWEVLLRARAIENLSYVLAAAQGGFHISGRHTWGHSMIIDPWGNILAEQSRGNHALLAEIDPEQIAATRRNFPSINHRRLNCQ